MPVISTNLGIKFKVEFDKYLKVIFRSDSIERQVSARDEHYVLNEGKTTTTIREQKKNFQKSLSDSITSLCSTYSHFRPHRIHHHVAL